MQWNTKLALVLTTSSASVGLVSAGTYVFLTISFVLFKVFFEPSKYNLHFTGKYVTHPRFFFFSVGKRHIGLWIVRQSTSGY